MLSNEKIRPYIFAFLAFCVVSSKHIIIYNEEILVSLSFFCFIVFVAYYFGDTIKESLDERSITIKSELQNFLNLKQESLTELFEEYKKVFLLKSILTSVGSFTYHELLKTSSGLEKNFFFIVSQQIQQKLKTLALSKTNLQQRLQPIVASNLLFNVLVKNNKIKKQEKKNIQLNPNFIKQSLQLLVITFKK